MNSSSIPGTHGVDELLVGRYMGKKFMFVECVKNGFAPATRRHVHAAIKDLKIANPTFANLPERKGAHRMDTKKMGTVTWVKPRVVVEIAMNEWTPGGHLRHAKFKQLRDDKKVSNVSAYPASV